MHRLLLPLAAFALLCACPEGGRPTARGQDRPASRVAPTDPKKPSYLDATAKHDGKTLSEWLAALESTDERKREAAMEAVAAYGPNAKGAVPALVKILTDPKVRDDRLRRHRDDGADEVVPRALVLAQLGQILPECGPLRRLPAVRPLEQRDHVLPLAVDDRLNLGLAGVHGWATRLRSWIGSLPCTRAPSWPGFK